MRCGVYIPQRHSGARVNVLAGDRLFPGRHERARFHSSEREHGLEVVLETADGAGDATASFDCAIVMRDRPVTWHALGRLNGVSQREPPTLLSITPESRK